MACFVINEWLWEDLAGHNSKMARRESFDFLTKFVASDHQMVWVEGSAFDRKAWALCKSRDTIGQRIGGIFVKDIRQDLDRCIVLKYDDTAVLPEEVAARVKDDDEYLVRAQLSVAGSILVTTDPDLCSVVSNHGLPCMSRDEFLKMYFSS